MNLHMDPIVRSDTRYCDRFTRAHSRTFSLATYFLPARKRRAAIALYAFCRTTGDLARSHAAEWKGAHRRLQDHRRDLTEALAGRPRGPVLREIRWTVREFDLPPDLLTSFVDGISHNVEPRSFETWQELTAHCDCMGVSIARMFGKIFGTPRSAPLGELALSYGRTLGVALQLTGILRDVAGDARNGRCVIPDEDLDRFELARGEVLDDPGMVMDSRWQDLMSFEIARTRDLYRQALPGITLLSEDSQRCVAGCAIGYASILDAVEHMRAESGSWRPNVSTMARIGVLWEAWRYRGQVRLRAS